MAKKMKIYIADDHTLFRKAMAKMIHSFPNVGEVKDAENGQELLTLMKYHAPDLVIIDLQMPIMDGTETCEQIVQKYPDVKIIILTMHDSDKYILHLIELGAHAFLLKNTEPEELERAIDSIMAKDFYHNDMVAAVLRKNVMNKSTRKRPVYNPSDLSEREKEILILVCRELTNKEIGKIVSLSENTIRNHKVNIMEKLKVNNAVGLVKYAYESGLLK
jgi:two-component system, NarL family, response regulator DegU